MIALIDLTYPRPKLTAEQQSIMRSCAISTYGNEPEFKDDEPDYYQYIVDLSVFVTLGIEFTVKRNLSPILEQIQNLETPRPIQFNERCHVSVAGNGLLSINDVAVHLDLCTDRLQELLDNGWSILAVCVQPDQRRPDYVLGRHS